MLGEADLICIFRERLPYTLCGNVARVLENLIEAPVLIEELERRLRPYAPGSGNVVGGVTDQGQVVDHLGRRNTEFLVGVPFVHPFGRHSSASTAPRVQEVDAGSYELIEILVTGHDDGLEPSVSRLDRESADDVIRLVAVQFYEGVIEPRHELAHAWQTGSEFIGHLLPGRLVRWIDFLPMTVSGVEHYR